MLTLCPSPSHSDEEPEVTLLPKDKLICLCRCEPILQWMRSCDHILYQALVETLIPDVLRPVPSKPPRPQARPPEPSLSPVVPSPANSSLFLTPGDSARKQGAKSWPGQVPGLSRRFPEGQVRAAKSHLLGKPFSRALPGHHGHQGCLLETARTRTGPQGSVPQPQSGQGARLQL